MLRITKQTDYAILLLLRLVQLGPEALLSARDGARWSGLSFPMVSKILKSLAREGILRSQRGVGGGYGLARDHAAISVADVIRALEGPIGIVECSVEPGRCDHEPCCPARVNWVRINREIENALDRVPIGEMISADADPLALVGAGVREPQAERETT